MQKLRKKLKLFLELNENENSDLWEMIKMVLIGKFRPLSDYIRAGENS